MGLFVFNFLVGIQRKVGSNLTHLFPLFSDKLKTFGVALFRVRANVPLIPNRSQLLEVA